MPFTLCIFQTISDGEHSVLFEPPPSIPPLDLNAESFNHYTVIIARSFNSMHRPKALHGAKLRWPLARGYNAWLESTMIYMPRCFTSVPPSTLLAAMVALPSENHGHLTTATS